MGKRIDRFEDLIAWQKARELTKQIYLATGQGVFAKDFSLKDQIRRASVSTMSNIAEGFERAKPREFHHFLSVAKGSCGELRSQLYVAFDVSYLNQDQFSHLLPDAEEVGRIIGVLRLSIEQKHRLF